MIKNMAMMGIVIVMFSIIGVTVSFDNVFAQLSASDCSGDTPHFFDGMCFKCLPPTTVSSDSACVTTCPGNQVVNSITNECVAKCPPTTVISDSVCVSKCPGDQVVDSSSNECVSECPNNLKLKFNPYVLIDNEGNPNAVTYCYDSCPAQTLMNSTDFCVKSCSETEILHNNACIVTCPDGHGLEGSECVFEARIDEIFLLNDGDTFNFYDGIVFDTNQLRFVGTTIFDTFRISAAATGGGPVTLIGGGTSVNDDGSFQRGARSSNLADGNYILTYLVNDVERELGGFTIKSTCTADQKISINGECIAVCEPDDKININICVAECPTNKVTSGNNCVDRVECTGTQVIDNNQCVATCPNDKKNVNDGECVATCPSDKPVIRRDNAQDTCFESCLPVQFVDQDNRCVPSCPKSYPFINDRVCVESCPSDKPFFKNNVCSSVDIPYDIVIDSVKFDIKHVGKFSVSGNSASELRLPSDMIITDSKIYVADQYHDRIQVFDLDGTHVESFGSKGSGTAQFDAPRTIAIHGDKIYVGDTGNKRIQVFNLAAGTHNASFDTIDDNKTFGSIKSIAVNSTGHLFVVDAGSREIHIFDSDNDHIKSFNEVGNDCDSSYPDGLHAPNSITIDKNDEIYITEFGGHRIQVYDSDGNHEKHFNDYTPANDNGINRPRGIATSDEHVFVVNRDHQINVHDLNNADFVASFGNERIGDNNGSSNQIGQLLYPAELAIKDNKLYVADTGNDRIQVFEFCNGKFNDGLCVEVMTEEAIITEDNECTNEDTSNMMSPPSARTFQQYFSIEQPYASQQDLDEIERPVSVIITTILNGGEQVNFPEEGIITIDNDKPKFRGNTIGLDKMTLHVRNIDTDEIFKIGKSNKLFEDGTFKRGTKVSLPNGTYELFINENPTLPIGTFTVSKN